MWCIVAAVAAIWGVDVPTLSCSASRPLRLGVSAARVGKCASMKRLSISDVGLTKPGTGPGSRPIASAADSPVLLGGY